MTTGMFLFAKLVMLNLYDQITREHFINEINESRFPRGLQEAYVKNFSSPKHETEIPSSKSSSHHYIQKTDKNTATTEY